MLRTVPIITALLAPALLLAQNEAPDHRMQLSADLVRQFSATPDRSVKDLMSRAKCVMVIPSVKKGAAVVGAEYGRGYAVCRQDGKWGGPAAIKLSGGSVGAQIGVESIDVVLFVMNEKGMQRLEKDKLTLGADASLAAGPTGRTAAAGTDISMKAEILSYSRSHGAFVGLALDGAIVSRDDAEDQRLYGRHITNGQIVRGEVAPPESAGILRSALAEKGQPGSN
jgi:lipid-binding SYLF domain-containing protein